jgi:hypothetical protein
MLTMGGSWAADDDERQRFIDLADQLRGFKVDRVRYFTIDYRRDEVAPGYEGSREINDELELAEPIYEFPGGHTLDYGLELSDRSGDTWSVMWIPPGRTEGLALHREPMFPNVLSSDGSIAIWDVSGTHLWASLLGSHVERVDVDYEPWSETSGSWWCRHLDLVIGSATVEILEAEGRPDGSLDPSADNLVVRLSSATAS